MTKQTIQIAITAIEKWEKKVLKEEGTLYLSPQFFADMKRARKELKAELLTN